MILNDAEIEAKMQELINSTWPPTKRERVLRTGVGLDTLNSFFAEMTAMKAQMIVDRDEIKALYDAEIAISQSMIPVEEV